MLDRAGDFVNLVLRNIISNTDCQNLILGNETFYVSLIDKAGEESSGFKEDLKRIIKDLSIDTPISGFAEKIGVTHDTEGKIEE